jgi:hypothetical protein
LAVGQVVAHMVENALDNARRLSARQAKAAMNDVGQVRTSEGICGVCVFSHARDAEIGHVILPP